MNQEAAAILDTPAPTPVQENNKEAPIGPTDGPLEPDARANDRVSSKLDILIKREAQAIARERLAKDKEADIEAKLKRIADFEAAKTDPDKALGLLGLSYDELTQAKLRDGQIPPEVEIRKLKEELDAFKNSTKQEKQTETEQRELEVKRQTEAREKQAVDNFKGEIKQYLSDNKARYELIEFESQNELVFEVIDEHYNRTIDPDTGTGKVMSISEAADKVEKYLEEKYHKSKELNKVKTLWGSLPKQVQERVIKQELPSPKPKTLTNTLSASSSAPRKTPITDDERVRRAIAYAKGLRP